MKGKPLAFTALFFLMMQVSSAAERAGVVRGTVLDDKGAPVSAAQVSVDALDSLPRLAPVRAAETDKNGRFEIAELELASYKIFVKKEQAGYPDTSFAFYSYQVFPTVTLTESSRTVDIFLRVGPPAGAVTGVVIDAATSQRINVNILLRRSQDPNEWISTGQRSDYRVLVPTDVDVILEVSPQDRRRGTTVGH